MPNADPNLPKMTPLIKRALEVAASGLPVFPTMNKKPAWSNAELGVGRGEGGYKIATTDPDRVVELFSHERATEIAVPMGEMSGLMCIDVDVHKLPELQAWMDSEPRLKRTRVHKTRNGGRHFLFQHPGDLKFPATLRAGVDIKATGTGYICWPGTEGYEVIGKAKPRKLDLSLVEDAMRAKGGSGSLTVSSDVMWNKSTDEELIEDIITARDLYPALRTLSMRLARKGAGRSDQITTLENIMNDSEAAQAGHPRHDDWCDRFEKIKDLVMSANEVVMPTLSDEVIERIQGPSMIPRPIGPQRETTTEDILRRVAEKEVEQQLPDGYDDFSVDELHKATLPSIPWLIKDWLPAGGIASLAGTSNVGKTRWLAAMAASLSYGRTEVIGLPSAEPATVVWIANEEHTADIQRRIKAAARHYDLYGPCARIVVRPKTEGTYRLVALNEIGNAELDEDNIAELVTVIRLTKAKLVILDPYITLSDAVDENSATSAGMITKAMLLITTLTGAAIIHAHHTPKDRSKDGDWYRGDSGGWRGSGAIYSGLDCGFTLSPWLPARGEARKTWKENALESNLSRWIVLDAGKIREGVSPPPVYYEMIGHELDEGFEIGVCSITNLSSAENAIMHAQGEAMQVIEIANAIYDRFGYGEHSITDVHDALKGPYKADKTQDPGESGWPLTDVQRRNAKYSIIDKMFSEPVYCTDAKVSLIMRTKASKGSRFFVVSSR